MPPKKDQDAAAVEALRTLCVLMATATEFNPDLDAAAAEIGIAQARNLPRKVNTIIEPIGYTMLKRAIVKLDVDAAETTTAKTTTPPRNATKIKAPAKSAEKKTGGRKPLAKKVRRKEESSEEEDVQQESDDEKGSEDDGADDTEEEDE